MSNLNVLYRRDWESEADHFRRLDKYAEKKGLTSQGWWDGRKAGVLKAILEDVGYLKPKPDGSQNLELSKSFAEFSGIDHSAFDFREDLGRAFLISWLNKQADDDHPVTEVIESLVTDRTLNGLPNPFYRADLKERAQSHKTIYALYRNRSRFFQKSVFAMSLSTFVTELMCSIPAADVQRRRRLAIIFSDVAQISREPKGVLIVRVAEQYKLQTLSQCLDPAAQEPLAKQDSIRKRDAKSKSAVVQASVRWRFPGYLVSPPWKISVDTLLVALSPSNQEREVIR